MRSALLLFVIFITSACFSFYAASDCLRNRAVCFGVGRNDAQMAPYKYRIAEPFLTRLANPSGTQEGAVIASIVIYSVLTAVTLPLLFIWLNRWMNSDRAIVGVMIYALVNVGAFHLWYLSLGTPIEVLCVVLTLTLIERKWWVIAPIVIVASLNRETAILLIAIYSVWNWEKGLKPFLILLGIYLGITTALHLILGSSEHVLGLIGTLQMNISNGVDGFFANLILAPLYWSIWRGYKSSPRQLRRLAIIGGLYMVAIAVGASLGEIQRLILPALPLLIPPIFSAPKSLSAPNNN